MLTRTRLAVVCFVAAAALAVAALVVGTSDADDVVESGAASSSTRVETTSTPPPASITSTTTADGTAAPPTEPPSSTTSSAAGAPPTTGCAASSGPISLPGGRSAVLRAPATAATVPALVVLHGYTGSPEAIERTSGLTSFAAARGAVVVYPQGTPVAGGGFGWATGTVRFSTSGVDDVAFLADVIDTLVAEHCVDASKIVVTGESNGGAMALLAGCQLRTRPALTAPVIPAIDDGTVEACGSGAPFPLLALAGRLDRTIPYDGVYPSGQQALSAQEDWFAAVATARNGCEPGLERVRRGGSEQIDGTACPVLTRLIAIDDGRHTWPAGPVGTGDLDPGSFPASETIWAAAGLG